MTVGTLVQPTQYAGNGSATTFSFPFLITAVSDLVVGFIVSGVYTEQTSGYSIPASGIGNSGGGQVIFTTAPPFGTTVDLRTEIPETQPTNFSNLGNYLPEANTAAVDRCVRLIQDLYRRTYQFGIHGPDTESVSWPALPNPTARANTNVGFDQNGQLSLTVALASALTQSVFNGFLSASNFTSLINQVTQTELSAGLVPVNTTYLASPYRDPRRDGVTGTALAMAPVDDTTTMQAHLNFVVSYSGWSQWSEAFHILTTGLAVNFSAALNRSNQGVRIEGVHNVASTINQNGSVLTNNTLLNCAAPGTTVAYECNFVLKDFGIVGLGKTATGLNMQNVALFQVERLQILGCFTAVQNASSLKGGYRDCIIESNINGYVFSQYGTSSGNNLAWIAGGVASGNTLFGVDFGGSTTDFQFYDGLECSQNGTGGTATSGSTTTLVDTGNSWLPSSLVGAVVHITTSGTAYSPTVTANTSNSLTFAAIGAAVTSSSTYYLGGGIIFRAAIAGSYGASVIGIKGLHFESNWGWAISTDGSASGLTLSVEDTLIESAGTGGRGINFAGQQFIAKNVQSPNSGDTWSLSPSVCIMENVIVGGALLDTSTYSTWRGVAANGNPPADCRPNTFTLTLSGSYGSGTVTAKQDGKEVTLVMPVSNIAASGSGTTITGSGLASSTVPNVLIPSATRIVDCVLIVNSLTVPGSIQIAASTGTITLIAVGGFTTAQVNGLCGGSTVKYPL